MTSRLIVNSIRHTGASADAITLDNSGNITCNGVATGFADNISGATYAAFDDVIYAATGFSWSVNTDGKLIATI